MWRCSGDVALSCMERISVAVTWPGEERGQQERSSSYTRRERTGADTRRQEQTGSVPHSIDALPFQSAAFNASRDQVVNAYF